MGKPNSQTSWILNCASGYSLIELMVVMAVIGAMAVMTFFGLKSFNSTQTVSNAQKEFVSNLRAVQNKIDNGQVLNVGPGSTPSVVQSVFIPKKNSSAGNNQYFINGDTITLPKGVTIENDKTYDLWLCFADRNLTQFDSTTARRCGPCTSGAGYVCSPPYNTASEIPLVITLSDTTGSFKKVVNISGYKTRVIDINAAP